MVLFEVLSVCNHNILTRMAGLNASEVGAVRESWSAVMAKKQHHGNEFLIRLFKRHPATQNFFKKFKGKPVDELRCLLALSNHSRKIMNGLNTIVASLGDNNKLSAYIAWMAKFHYKMDLKMDYFKLAFCVLVSYFQEIFRTELSRIGWEKAFNIVHNRLEDEYKILCRVSTEEIIVVRECWMLVMERRLTHGTEFLIRLFKTYPETKDYFKQFRGRSLEELRSSKELAIQSGKILDGLDSVISALDDSNKLWGIIHWFGKFHYDMNIHLDYFMAAFGVLLSYVEGIFGRRFNRTVWEKTFTIVFNGISDEYENLEGLNNAELAVIRENWRVVVEEKEMHGDAFLYRLFQAYPSTQEFFENFRGKTVEEMKSLPAVTLHSGKIMDGLTNIVEALDDTRLLTSHINWMVKLHASRKVKIGHFEYAFGILLDYLQDIFGASFSREVWKKTLSILYDRLADGFRERAALGVAEMADVRKTWTNVMLNKSCYGSEFLIRLFTAYPAIQDKFVKFRGRPLCALRTGETSPALLYHSGQLMDGFNNIVDLLDDNRRLNIFLEWMAKFHYNKGIKQEYLQYGFTVMVDYLHDVFGGQFKKTSWEKTFAIVQNRLEAAYARVASYTASDVETVQGCWKAVMKNKTVHGKEFLIRLVKARPAARNYFQKFRETDFDKLESLPAFCAHSDKIMDGLNNLIEALDNSAKLQGHLEWMAGFHYNMNIQLNFFQDAFSVMTAYLQDVFGSLVNQSSLEKTFDVIYRNLAEEYAKVEKLL